ncbi:MAG: 50S ribosomal protein L15 [Deltaproteobacteria bacterium]|nr:MAG: 50S ribosomal protein L15 [Deltaproteobacteria bacterium]
MRLDELKPPGQAKQKAKRFGRGQGSGRGGTAGRGTKGQGARSGGGTPPGFEGGQMPLQRRLPKRGFRNPFKKRYAEINVRDLDRFEAEIVVDENLLRQSGLVKGRWDGVKLLGTGDISKPLTVKLHRCSAAARDKIEAVGGKIEVI